MFGLSLPRKERGKEGRKERGKEEEVWGKGGKEGEGNKGEGEWNRGKE